MSRQQMLQQAERHLVIADDMGRRKEIRTFCLAAETLTSGPPLQYLSSDSSWLDLRDDWRRPARVRFYCLLGA